MEEPRDIASETILIRSQKTKKKLGQGVIIYKAQLVLCPGLMKISGPTKMLGFMKISSAPIRHALYNILTQVHTDVRSHLHPSDGDSRAPDLCTITTAVRPKVEHCTAV